MNAQQGAEFSEAVYSNTMIQGKTIIDGYTLVKFESNPSNGFAAAVFQNTQTGQYIIAFRGTESSNKDYIN